MGWLEDHVTNIRLANGSDYGNGKVGYMSDYTPTDNPGKAIPGVPRH